jgi:transposase
VFPGNTNDTTTVERVKADLRGWKLGRCVFVGDAGMNSEENRRTLTLGGGKYILAARMRAGDEVTKQVLTRAGRYRTVAGNLRVKEVVVGDGERRQRYVVCHNPDEATRQRRHRAQVLVELQAELATLQAPKRGLHHSKRTCELLTTERYRLYLRETKRGVLRINRHAVTAAEKYDGKWVVTSNDDTLTAEDLALGYKQLMQVEQCWRMLKSALRMRPVYHWQPHRIHAHVSIAVLALLLTRMAETRANDTWRNVAALLQTIKVVDYERGEARIHQTTEVRKPVQDLLRALKVPLPQKIHAMRPSKTA